MTARPIGDFAPAASAQLDDAIGPPRLVSKRKLAAARADRVQEFSRGLADVLDVMARYPADITSTFTSLTAQQRRMLCGPWARASIQVQDAIQYAATFLATAHEGTSRSGGRRPGRAASGLEAAAFSLTVGRDLLNTHFAAGPEGARLDRSEWAPVVASRPVTRALLYELGQWAQTIASQGARLALSGPPVHRGTEKERRRLNAACRWLWVLHSAVQAADRRDPVLTADIRLLHSIPVHELAPALCQPASRRSPSCATARPAAPSASATSPAPPPQTRPGRRPSPQTPSDTPPHAPPPPATTARSCSAPRPPTPASTAPAMSGATCSDQQKPQWTPGMRGCTPHGPGAGSRPIPGAPYAAAAAPARQLIERSCSLTDLPERYGDRPLDR
jgi:hypothetical protein